MQSPTYYDVVILGTGPAGLQAAIHAARKKASVLVLGKETKSSLFHAHIENFCCIFNVSGEEILRTGRQQAANFGSTFLEEDILHISQSDDEFLLKTESGFEIMARSLIIATGAARNKLGVPGEKELLGKGVSYCVDCDGNFYKNQVVAVVGSESAAVDGALTLQSIAHEVHLICDELNVTPTLKEKLKMSQVKLHTKTKVKEIFGGNEVEKLILINSGEISVNGVFIELGAKGLMELATSLGIALDDEMRFIATNKDQSTNINGIFAAGDICGPPWQMAKAVGEGCVAGINAAIYTKTKK
ncbi:MAG: FAD-dependent oxidoreductase [Desulfobacteraceae bacterium]|jgi:thioredoxin reductase (NADPH)